MNLIMFCYNFLRTTNILGFDKMLQATSKWTPDYSKVVGVFKNAVMKMIYRQNKPIYFLTLKELVFKGGLKQPGESVHKIVQIIF